MHAQTRAQSPPRRPAAAVRPPRAPAHSWSAKIRQQLPLLVACGLLIAASGYALTMHGESTTTSAEALR